MTKLRRRKKTEYLDDQRFGRKQITQYIEKNHPELSRDYAQAKDLLTKVAQFKQEQYLQERMQHKEKSKGRDFER